jgi:prepilin-type N-terminal cleavage/methylation domain-containing protein
MMAQKMKSHTVAPEKWTVVLTNQQGISLIEVMIVLVLIGLTGLFAAPDIMQFRPNMQLKSAARDLFGDFQNAKLAAVRENQNCAVSFNVTIGADNFDYVVFMDANQDFIYTAGETILSEVVWSDAHKFVMPADGGTNTTNFLVPAGGKPTIVFQSNGLPADSDGGIANGSATFTVKTGETAQVVVSRVGNISIN